MLDGGARLGAEVALQHARDVAAVGPERLLEPRAQFGHDGLGRLAEARLHLARGVLEVLPQHLDRRAGLLAVEHPGADLDRVRDHPRRILTAIDPRPHELGGDRVVDDQALDDHAPEQGGDARLAEWGGCGFHDGESQARRRC